MFETGILKIIQHRGHLLIFTYDRNVFRVSFSSVVDHSPTVEKLFQLKEHAIDVAVFQDEVLVFYRDSVRPL